MIRVEAMFKESLSKVMMSKREGNTENSSGEIINTATMSTISEKVMLKERRRSSNTVEIGITITPRIVTIPTATNISCGLCNNTFKPPVSAMISSFNLSKI
jgi:hypothetical protein